MNSIHSLITLILVLFTIGTTTAQDCGSMTQRFASYGEAVRTVRSTRFQVKDSISTPESSWIKRAEFYSCNGTKGYFIYETKSGKIYIHSDLPSDMWIAFKNAQSKGGYYNRHIKGRYRLNLK